MLIYTRLRTIQYDEDMKKLILAAALLLTTVGVRNPLPKFNDPIPECPPLCDNNVIAQVN